jgi:hypothetical protein
LARARDHPYAVVPSSGWSEVALAQASSCGCELEFIVMRISILRATDVFTTGALFLASCASPADPRVHNEVQHQPQVELEHQDEYDG